MGTRILKFGVSVLQATVVLLAVGAVVWFFVRKTDTSYQDILFYVGAAPVVLFTIGMFGDFVGRGNISYQLSRSVDDRSPNKRGADDANETTHRVLFSLKWILSGLLVWFISYFL